VAFLAGTKIFFNGTKYLTRNMKLIVQVKTCAQQLIILFIMEPETKKHKSFVYRSSVLHNAAINNDYHIIANILNNDTV
jgi:hypothetical protein